MVEWLAGNRIRGTNTERVGVTSQATPTKIIDGNYTVLTYTADGKFIPKNSFDVEYLVVAGGGGGGGDIGGGGGAGGYKTNFGGTALGVTAQSYSITVGAGGAGGGTTRESNTVGTDGVNSVFSTITSTGGGGGGAYWSNNASYETGRSGGSAGGGGCGTTTSTGVGGTASPSGQGNNGGTAYSSNPYWGGGGGGSSVAGGTASSTASGAGGAGTSNSITGTATYYGGGGGGTGYGSSGTGSVGGAGGIGGGGAGGYSNVSPNSIGIDATSNTGGGGGGGGYDSAPSGGGSGGSGIVILRFLTSGNTYDVEEIGLMQSLASGSVGGWHEIGRTTLGSAGDTIDVSSLADKRYLMVLTDIIASGSVGLRNRLGNSTIDTGSNYGIRSSWNGGSDGSWASQDYMYGSGGSTSVNLFDVGYIANKSDKEKLKCSWDIVNTATGEGTAPNRGENVGKWANTSNAIDIIRQYNALSGDFNTNSEVVVLGWDPADTHTTNFWEELASADWSSGYQINSGTFTAKKYLWIQGWYKNAANTSYARFRVGNNTIDNANNYANRYSLNGAGDNSAGVSTDHIKMNVTNTDASSGSGFFNMFIINNTSNEKLVIGHHTLTASGVSNYPARNEFVAKWNETSNQINVVELHRYGGNNFTAGGIKVWGSN